MNIEHINAPETGCTPEEQAAWHAGIEAGREIERNNIAAQAQPDAGLDVEAVLRQFLTGDGFIAECDIRHIVAALTAQPAISGYTCTVPDDCETLHWRGQILSMNELASVAQPAAGEEIMVNAPGDVYTLPLQPSGLSSGPRFVVHVPGPEQPEPDVSALVEALELARRTLAMAAIEGEVTRRIDSALSAHRKQGGWGMTDKYQDLRDGMPELQREAARKGGYNPRAQLIIDLLAERDALNAEIEALREDACVALVADIRFACGDNGKRMQSELVEYIQELARDAARYRWLRERWGRVTETYDGDSGRITAIGTEPGGEGWEIEPETLDAAIDDELAKGGDA